MVVRASGSFPEHQSQIPATFSQNSICRGLLQLRSWPLMAFWASCWRSPEASASAMKFSRRRGWLFEGTMRRRCTFGSGNTRKRLLGVNIRLESMVRLGTAIYSRVLQAGSGPPPSIFHFFLRFLHAPNLVRLIQDGRLRLLACTSNLFLILNCLS